MIHCKFVSGDVLSPSWLTNSCASSFVDNARSMKASRVTGSSHSRLGRNSAPFGEPTITATLRPSLYLSLSHSCWCFDNIGSFPAQRSSTGGIVCRYLCSFHRSLLLPEYQQSDTPFVKRRFSLSGYTRGISFFLSEFVNPASVTHYAAAFFSASDSIGRNSWS